MTTATKYDAAQQRPGCCCATTTCYGLLLKGEDITDRYGVGTLPAVYIIGADGRVVYRHEGVAKDFGSVIKKAVARLKRRASPVARGQLADPSR